MKDIEPGSSAEPSIDERMKSLLTRIKERRKALNYTQDYVGRKIGISQHAYSKFESGTTDFSISKLCLLAKALEVELIDLCK